MNRQAPIQALASDTINLRRRIHKESGRPIHKIMGKQQRISSQTEQTLIVNITLVLLELKDGYLIDCCQFSIENCIQFLSRLKLPVSVRNLLLIEVDMDIFIVNRKLLKEKLNRVDKYLIVDLTGDSPSCASCSGWQGNTAFFSLEGEDNIINGFSVLQIGRESEVYSLLGGGPGLAGWLLGYACIYSITLPNPQVKEHSDNDWQEAYAHASLLLSYQSLYKVKVVATFNPYLHGRREAICSEFTFPSSLIVNGSLTMETVVSKLALPQRLEQAQRALQQPGWNIACLDLQVEVDLITSQAISL